VEPLIKQKLDVDIFENDICYFFTSMTNRFDYANDLLATLLQKKYGKIFRPIYIYLGEPAVTYQKQNYLIVNRKFIEFKKSMGTVQVIAAGQEYEDLNCEVCSSKMVEEIINNIAKKQDKIFYFSFTSSFLNFKNPKVVIIGPDPKIAQRYDDKLEQYRLFQKLDLPYIKFREYSGPKDIKVCETYPLYVTAHYTSGGCESAVIRNPKDLKKFYSELRDVNKKKSLIVCDFVKDVAVAPNINAIVTGKNTTLVVAVTDQILRGNAYLGNISPSVIDDNKRIIIETITRKVGNFLSILGFRGIFGLDFLIDKSGKVYVNDLNPRRQGAYMCNLLTSKRVNLLEIELLLALGEGTPDLDELDFKIDYCWAHSKVKVHYSDDETDSFAKLVRPLDDGSITNVFRKIGSEFVTTFYPKDFVITCGYPGYYVTSDYVRQNVVDKISSRPDEALDIIMADNG
jgi:predicted ATP-grasp superfamily ATP-dependent carboligase